MSLTTYTYRGTHVGPDLFDEPPAAIRERSAYDVVTEAERDRAIAYWYGRGMSDNQIAGQVSCSPYLVARWRKHAGKPAHGYHA